MFGWKNVLFQLENNDKPRLYKQKMNAIVLTVVVPPPQENVDNGLSLFD